MDLLANAPHDMNIPLLALSLRLYVNMRSPLTPERMKGRPPSGTYAMRAGGIPGRGRASRRGLEGRAGSGTATAGCSSG